MPDKIIGELGKNAIEKYVFALKEYKGKQFIDIRTFYLADAVKNEWRPTKKGITITAAVKKDFINLMNKAIAELK